MPNSVRELHAQYRVSQFVNAMLDGTSTQPVEIETLPDDLRAVLEEQTHAPRRSALSVSFLHAQPSVLPRCARHVGHPPTGDKARARDASDAAQPLCRVVEHFSEAEKVALEYANAITDTRRDVDDELFARLKQHYDDDTIAELTMIIS